MISFRLWIRVFFALALGGGRIFAAAGHEDRDFTAAASAFQDGMYSRAEVEFAQFAEKYPKSPRVAEAGLMQAEADFKQGKLTQAIALLTAHEPQAGNWEDQYVYWIGEAQFQDANYSDAAETFSRLARDFPNSNRRLDAVVNEAAARAKLGQWPQVSALLQKTNGVFQKAMKTDAGNEQVVGGRLLLAEALLAQNHPDDAAALLQPPLPGELRPELDWKRIFLLCRAQLAGGNTNAALALTTHLIQVAKNIAGRGDLLAESVSEQAGVMERLGQISGALSAYSENLTTNAPVEWQRQAIMKIAELAAAQNQFSDAEQSLEKFLGQFPDARASDIALLTLGELHLKDYAAQPAVATNDLQEAHSRFDQFIGVFTNSPLLGRAYLDRGWCFWSAGEFPPSGADFKTAAEKLPPSVDLAVARFKLGDAEYQQNNFAGARENYEAVADDFTNFPIVGETFGAQVLYQTLRVCMNLNDVAGASNALARILKIYPTSNLADKSILLVGEGQSDLGYPVRARTLFQTFEENYPHSEQLPEVELAIARTYEQENNWPDAISIYDRWVGLYTNNMRLLPQVEYARAWANYQDGDETNAFALFTRFIAQFPQNPLAPVAQWWIGDHFFRTGTNYVDAEKNYELVFQNWPSNYFAYPAKMMAGRAAMARNSPSDAIQYFTSLTSDTNCPPDLDAQARFAYGSARMLMPSSDTNNPLANYQEAILIFKTICATYPGSEQAALAQGEIGDCYLQLAAQAPHFYDDATNAYAQVVVSPDASVAARSQAQIGIGMVLEKKAALAHDGDQTNLFNLALQNYTDVLYKSNLRDGESPDPFWRKKAGLQAAGLVEALDNYEVAINIYARLEDLFPEAKASLEKKIAAAQEHLQPQKN